MAEKEYISREALKRDLIDHRNFYPAIVKAAIEDVPAADVVEVKHGEWKKVSEKSPRYVCTSCNHLYNNKEYKYCPNCGANMDGERKEQVDGN